MEEGLIYDTNNHVREYDVVAIVLDYDKETGLATCRQRNKFVKGDKVEILSPAITGDSFVVNELYNEDGETIEGCPHPGMICKVKVPYQLEKNTFIRKELVKI
jgi:putative protease